ncbi:MAG: anti-sigma factor antagonist [Solirubrobacteraceae bacterium]|nr:anti-sigma factor antagonist [Solirubrobacteraceae bacterium]
MTSLTIEVQRHGEATLLELHGELDLGTAQQLRETLIEVIGEGTRVVVDLELVDFIDSVGLGVLVGGLKRARTRNGELVLVCTSRAALKPLEITGLDRVFTIHGAREAALAS